jgi:uncharacterized membrane protein YbhN (UPF0104 family)
MPADNYAAGRTYQRSLRPRLVRYWLTIRRGLWGVFVLAIAAIGVMLTRKVDGAAVYVAMRNTPLSVLAVAWGLAALSYTLYSMYDVLGRWYTGHALTRRRSALIGAISYAFNLSLGALVGGMGFRYRLYCRHGIAAATVTRILGLSLVTNWLGYCMLGGLIAAVGTIKLPPGWEVGSSGLRLIGVALMMVATGYCALCVWARRRKWSFKGHEIALPTGRLALLQLTVSLASWMSIGGIIYTLLQSKVNFFLVLGIFMLSSIAGAFTHIPGGLGVIEAVFVALLGGQLPTAHILGALVVYRAIYYLTPLVLATLVYVGLETRLKKRTAPAQ